MSFRHVGSGLTRMIAQWIEDPDLRWRLVCRAWRAAVGEAAAAHATPLRLEEETLVVRVDSLAWQRTLEGLRSQLEKRLQEEVGAEFVRRVAWQLAAPDDPTAK